MTDAIRFSIVIPVKNEEENIPLLGQEIDEVFAGVAYAWEAVWVDDGSTDASVVAIKALGGRHRLVKFARNQGQSAAFVAGFQHARGEWVGTLDADGQNDPRDLVRQLAHAEQVGVDMVNGIRAKRQDTWFRKLQSRIGNGFRNAVTGETQVKDVGCSTRVVKRDAVLRVPFFHGNHRFLPTLVRQRGFTMDQIPVNHRPRARGVSKYGMLNRAFVGTVDCFGVRWLGRRARHWEVSETT
jgi:dolichol-phosphate mannosyltransferase